MDAETQRIEAAAGAGPQAPRTEKEPFSRGEIAAFLRGNAAKLARAAARLEGSDAEVSARLSRVHGSLAAMAAEVESPPQPGAPVGLEDLERRLTALEEKLHSALTSGASEEVLVEIRRDLDRQLAPHRRRMSGPQLAQLERQYLQKRLFEKFDVPRLSLFYLT